VNSAIVLDTDRKSQASERNRRPAATRGRPNLLLLRIHYRGNVPGMAIAQSKVTAQGQISVPAEVRKKLGVGPGSVLEWDEQGSEVVVRRAGRHSSKDIHLALFPAKTLKKDLPDVKDAIRKYIRKRHARG
jgi:antitoxin PrlF